ncbi:uncharacterized protein N0V89_008133 [Didymosphaeria variabile]|uniref:RING-type domain-containing protein n=1 Tax=Didymosphaeria variabile TaxID=1932322 RepID=A0A9W8XH11_9PLEO|nr:uncharacterized protein N0V89_008133 [Didymosphaeria variabile]KAJ4349517.1 hypothetical protein N0V89_008133 [Didymosphaeria variabile]
MSSPTSSSGSSAPPSPSPSQKPKKSPPKPPKPTSTMPSEFTAQTPPSAPEWLKPCHDPTTPSLVSGAISLPSYTYSTPSVYPPPVTNSSVHNHPLYPYSYNPPSTIPSQPLTRKPVPRRLPTKADFLKNCVTLAKEGDRYNDDKCAFCWTGYDVAHPGVKIEPCGHVFGAACLEQIVEGENLCPKCRVPLFERERTMR